MGKRGVVLMFIGALLLSLFLFVQLPISFELWAIGFVISMLIAGSGAVLSIIELAKSIKADYALRNNK